MKKVICANEVKAAADTGLKVISMDSSTIVTPAAKDLAKELGVEFTLAALMDGKQCCKPAEHQQTIRQVPAIDRELICDIVKAVLAKGFLAKAPEKQMIVDREPQSGLKIVRGRTVNYEPFDTGNPGTQVAYREVVSKDESQMSAGFLTIEQSSFDWELSYEEVDIVLEGNLAITINGQTYEACQGDVLFIPKGSKVTWSASGYVKLFYVTYPANWPDLMAKQ